MKHSLSTSSPSGLFRPLVPFCLLCCLSTLAFAKPDRYIDPREDVAWTEMGTLANAEEACAIETTYFVALEALNDGSVDFPSRHWDWINYGGGSYAVRPAEGRFGASRHNFLTAYLKWGGPYMTFQAGKWQTGTTPYDQGSPLDPWGNPYYFFSPLGLLRGDTGVVTQELYGDTLTDRYAILSLGADMMPGGGDDLRREFGTGVSITALTSLRGDGVLNLDPTSSTAGFLAPAGGVMRLRGINLGSQAPDGRLLFANQLISNITSWTSREIEFTLPAEFGGQIGTLRIDHSGMTWGNELKVTVYAIPNAARAWQGYE